MTPNRILNALPGLNPDEMKQLESLVGPLPSELREFYTSQNGGEPERGYFEDDSGSENAIDSFTTALHRRFDHEVTLEEYYQRAVKEHRTLGERYVPFARNAGDDLYLMDRENGTVHFWAHDAPGEALRFVAPSLATILARAQTEDDFYG